jgi:hypothetical protein
MTRFETDFEPPRHSTLLALVQSLWDELESEAEVAETAAALVESGRVVLTGNFAGCPLVRAAEVR